MTRGALRGLRAWAAVAAGGVLISLAVAAPPSAGAAVDTTAPTVTSVSAVSRTVGAGSPIALRFTAVDDVAVDYVAATYTGPGGITVQLIPAGGTWTWQSRIGGPIAGVVPRGAPAGSYVLTRLTAYDAAGNYTDYVDGAATSVPSGTPAVLDLSPATITVTRTGAADTTAPQLTAFSMLSSTDRRRGEFATWSYATAPDASPIVDVRVFVKLPGGAAAETHRGGGDLRKGRISFAILTDAAIGTWTVTAVQLTDSAGNIRTYGPNGVGLQTGSPSHKGPSFQGMTFRVGTGTPRLDTIRVLDERPEPVVRTVAPTTPVAIGSTAALAGSVRFLGSGVPYPVLALYRNTGGTRSFVRLVTGSSTGAYSTRVPVGSTSLYQLLFLGSDRTVASAVQVMGKPVRVRAGVKQALSVAATSITVPPGRSATLVVRLSPARAGASLVLRRWTGSTWAAVRTVTTRADGKAFATVSRPAMTSKYRWTTAYDGTGLAATSPTVTVRR